MRALSFFASAVLVASALSASPLFAEDLFPPTAACSDAKVSALNEQAARFEQTKQLDTAAGTYTKADKQAKGQCSRSLFGQYDNALKMQDAKLAVSAANRLTALAPDDAMRSRVEVLAATGALVPKQGEEKAKPGKDQAEEAYRLAKLAIQHDKTNAHAYEAAGRAVMLLGKEGEARETFAMMERVMPAGSPAALRAHRLAENPAGAVNPSLPTFTATTLTGEKISDQDLAGKTILFDFWATWCPACVEDTDYLKMLANRYKDRNLAVVSVSVDSSEMKWKDYIEENRMHWPQVLDKDKHMRELFNVGAFPTYILVDQNANVCERIVGSREDLQAKLLKVLPTN